MTTYYFIEHKEDGSVATDKLRETWNGVEHNHFTYHPDPQFSGGGMGYLGIPLEDFRQEKRDFEVSYEEWEAFYSARRRMG